MQKKKEMLLQRLVVHPLVIEVGLSKKKCIYPVALQNWRDGNLIFTFVERRHVVLVLECDTRQEATLGVAAAALWVELVTLVVGRLGA